MHRLPKMRKSLRISKSKRLQYTQNGICGCFIEHQHFESASGGVFASVATEFINDSGIVVGSAMENTGDKLLPHHIAVDNLTDLKNFWAPNTFKATLRKYFPQSRNYLIMGKRFFFRGLRARWRHFIPISARNMMAYIQLI